MTPPIRFDANLNDPTERSYFEGAKSLLQRGDNPADVAMKLSRKVHQYRASLGQKQDEAEPLGTAGQAAGLLAKGYQGLTLGAGNKISALLESLPLVGTGLPYAENLKRYNAALEQTSKELPVASTAAEMVGSVLPIVATGGGAAPAAALPEGAGMLARLGQSARALTAGAPEGAGTLARLGNYAKQGAVYGGATGALSANAPEDVASGALRGASTGAIGGAVLGPTIGAAARLGGRLLPASISQALGNAPQDAASQAQRMIKGALGAGGVEALDVAPAHIPGSALTMMDLAMGQPAVRSLALAAKNVPNSGAAKTIETAMRERAAGAGPRIASALSEASNIPREEFGRTVEQLSAAKQAEAAPLYKAAMMHEGISPNAQAAAGEAGAAGPTLAKLFERPSVQLAMRYGNKIAAEAGEALPNVPHEPAPVAAGHFTAEQWNDLVKRNPQLGNGEEPVPMQTLHDVKIKLDDMLGYARNKGQLPDGTAASKAMLRKIQDTKNQLLAIIDTHNPAYQKARSVFAGHAASEDAFANGREFFRSAEPAEVGQQMLETMTPAEQEMFRRGGMTWVQQKLKNASANPDLPMASRSVNAVQRLLGSAEDADKIKLLFGNTGASTLHDLNTMLEPETVFPQTQSALLRQSTTAAQQQAGKLPVNAWDIKNGLSALRGSPYGMIRTGLKMAGMATAPQQMSPQIANEIASRVTLTGPQMAREYARIMAMPDATTRKAALNALLAGVAGGAVAPSSAGTP